MEKQQLVRAMRASLHIFLMPLKIFNSKEQRHARKTGRLLKTSFPATPPYFNALGTQISTGNTLVLSEKEVILVFQKFKRISAGF